MSPLNTCHHQLYLMKIKLQLLIYCYLILLVLYLPCYIYTICSYLQCMYNLFFLKIIHMNLMSNINMDLVPVMSRDVLKMKFGETPMIYIFQLKSVQLNRICI